MRTNLVGGQGALVFLFCHICQRAPLRALGYRTRKQFDKMVKEDVMNRSAPPINEEDVPFYLIDEDDAAN